MKLKFILIALITLLFCVEEASAQSRYYYAGPRRGVTVRFVGGSQWKRPYRAVRQRIHKKHFHKNPYRNASYDRYDENYGRSSMGNGYYRRSSNGNNGCYRRPAPCSRSCY